MASPVSLSLRRLGLSALAVGLIALSVTGCVRLLEPRTSDATYYLLHDPQSWSFPSTDTTGLAVGLRRTRMASYLTDTRLVVRRGPHQIHFSEFHRWAEELNRGISRTVALALMDRPDVRLAETVPWPKGSRFDYIVQLHVLNFEGVGPPPDPKAKENAPAPEGHSQMVVRWTILEPESETVLARGLTRHEHDGWRVTNYGALASHLGEGLQKLANDLGDRLQTLDSPEAP
ncbi:MAG: membrane integrity-associated transporter subunit PqiC [Salinibacter sp.]